ncbi:hypothetical protein AB0J35_01060 [Nonomuraea angiospora]|uniref:hypothetical protein n=1 Tax=Nonomuraea angiospora TaxID=46172 RepID=UPI003412605F
MGSDDRVEAFAACRLVGGVAQGHRHTAGVLLDRLGHGGVAHLDALGQRLERRPLDITAHHRPWAVADVGEADSRPAPISIVKDHTPGDE